MKSDLIKAILAFSLCTVTSSCDQGVLPLGRGKGNIIYQISDVGSCRIDRPRKEEIIGGFSCIYQEKIIVITPIDIGILINYMKSCRFFSKTLSFYSVFLYPEFSIMHDRNCLSETVRPIVQPKFGGRMVLREYDMNRFGYDGFSLRDRRAGDGHMNTSYYVGYEEKGRTRVFHCISRQPMFGDKAGQYYDDDIDDLVTSCARDIE